MKILRRSATSGGFPPLWCLTAPPFPRKRWHYKAPLCCEPLMKGLLCRALLSHRSAGGRWWRQPPRGACISDTRRAVVWFSPPKAAFILAPPRAPTSPAQRYYITPEGESPQPACKASADHRQNPWRPGPKARRRHQPSPAKASVNLREYWKAPPFEPSEPSHPSGLVPKPCTILQKTI